MLYVAAAQDGLAVTVSLMKSGRWGNNNKRDATAKQIDKSINKWQQAEENAELKDWGQLNNMG